MTELEKEIHADAREATARQTFRAVTKTDRPDIAIAIILRAIDEWFEKGMILGNRRKGFYNIAEQDKKNRH